MVDFIVGIKVNTTSIPVYMTISMCGNTIPSVEDKYRLAEFINDNTSLICDEVVFIIDNNGDVAWEIENNDIGDGDVIPI